MKLHFLKQRHHNTLILFFAGFAQGPQLLDNVIDKVLESTDLALIYDYQDLDFPLDDIKGYKRYYLVGWSLGVFMASYVQDTYDLKADKLIAINGTLKAIDESLGIDRAMYMATYENLTDKSLVKFMRRICGGALAYSKYEPYKCTRSVEMLKAELLNIEKLYAKTVESNKELVERKDFDKAYIGTDDLIFDKDRQLAFWQRHSKSVVQMPYAHYDSDLFAKVFEDLTDDL